MITLHAQREDCRQQTFGYLPSNIYTNIPNIMGSVTFPDSRALQQCVTMFRGQVPGLNWDKYMVNIILTLMMSCLYTVSSLHYNKIRDS